MKIYITTGVGTGSTILSAFDDALLDTGVCNYNLIYLSSVIPPATEIVEVDKYDAAPEDFGNRLYVVRACEASDKKGETIAAAVGRYQLENGGGFFVEHHEAGDESMTEKVINDVYLSLEDLCARRDVPFDRSNVKYNVSNAIVGDDPTCVMALAVYKTENW